MHVHHLDCATMCPFGGARLGGVDRMVGHCLLIEAPGGLVLVDTGFGLDDAGRLPSLFRLAAGPRLDPERTAVRQVAALGHDPRDVRDIVLTHLDLDHAGGLPDFPHARVHVHAAEHAAAQARKGLRAGVRYLPGQWAHGVTWVLHEAKGERWRGFEAVREIPGLPPEILLVPLHGHTRGHQGIAVDTGRGWLLHAGDQYVHASRMSGARCPPQLAMFERFIAHDAAAVRANQARLRELAQPDVTVFSAHDAGEFDALYAGSRNGSAPR